MPKFYVYKMVCDNGGAPCVYPQNSANAVLSLSICKPMIRSSACKGDWLFGFGGKKLGGRLIYIAEVDEVLKGGEYYRNPKYMIRPDCIYQKEGVNYSWKKGSDFHKNGSNIDHDLGKFPERKRAIALLINNFRYFGEENTLNWQEKYDHLKTMLDDLKQGHRVNHSTEVESDLNKLKDAIWRQYPDEKQLGLPTNREKCGKSSTRSSKCNCGS
ncbi:MAG: hypothetical protein PHV34_11585 [Verrucomicrobiae bacterium]|nr:hypothetical protein [Verrucomicrobiae bacterium]